MRQGDGLLEGFEGVNHASIVWPSRTSVPVAGTLLLLKAGAARAPIVRALRRQIRTNISISLVTVDAIVVGETKFPDLSLQRASRLLLFFTFGYLGESSLGIAR